MFIISLRYKHGYIIAELSNRKKLANIYVYKLF